jgi:NAD(P)-dependent dehydrogenase (short-subunit alcohol dehydrogenase family)
MPVVEGINELYPKVKVHARKFDAGDEGGVKAVVAHALETYGRLDVFFANAATSGTWKRSPRPKYMNVNALSEPI